MDNFKLSRYELVKYEEDPPEGGGKTEEWLRNRMNRKVLEHCASVCADLVDNTENFDKRVAVRTMEFADGKELPLNYMEKLFRDHPNEESREIGPLSDASDVELDGEDSDVEEEKIARENTNMIQQNLRHLVRMKSAREIGSVSEFDDPLCANVNIYNRDEEAWWKEMKNKMKMLHPTELDKLDRELTVVAEREPETKELTADKLIASLDRKHKRKVAKTTEGADSDDERNDSDCDSDSYGEDVDWDGHGYKTDEDGDSDWEKYVKDCTYYKDYDNYRRAGRMLRERSLREELSKAVLPDGRVPTWLKRLGSQLFLDLEKDESLLRSMQVFVKEDKDAEGSWDFNRLLFLRRDNLSKIQQALCAMAIFADFMDANGGLYQCVRDFIARTRCGVVNLSLAIWKLDVMMERLLVISKKEGNASQLQSEAFSCRDRASFKHADVVESLVPVWVVPFGKWLRLVLSLSADNASYDPLTFKNRNIIRGWLHRMSDLRSETARKELDRWYRSSKKYNRRRQQVYGDDY